MTKCSSRFQPFSQRCWVRTQLSRAIVTFLVVVWLHSTGLTTGVQAQINGPSSPAIAQNTSASPSSVQSASPIVVGVVQSTDNADQWQDIVERLELAGISYRVIDWQQVDRTTNFNQDGAAVDQITVLFLPDVESVTSEQVLALQNWINRGGGVIVTGPVGRDASSGVQRSLRSLLGAYWVAPLSEPVRLQPTVINSQRWLRQGDTESQVMGGSLIPTDLGSQSVATWNTTGDSNPASGEATATPTSAATNTVAIVTTRQTVFLGWRWGQSAASSINFDSRWLRAAVSRFEEFPPVIAAAETDSPSSRPSATPLVPTAPTVSRPQAVLQPAPSTQPPQTLLPLPPRPTERPAPAGLQVEPGSALISIVDSIAMQRELKNLIGRFESALLAADSAHVDLAAVQPKSNEPQAPQNTAATGLNDPILQTARQKLESFTDLIRQRDYAAAREQWLQARQLLWDHFPTDRVFAPSEIRAIWLDRETIVAARSRQGLTRIFDQLAAAGINTVFFETVNAGYPIYPSQVAPQQNPLTRHWDPLADAVELAHDRQMELHAWVWTFAVGNEAHNRVINIPLDYPGPIVAEHPNWASYDNQGNLILPGQEEAFLDPANPQARHYLLQLFEEIVTRYDVDGLQLDYIRYPFQSANAGRSQGYGTAARQQFQRLTGTDPITLSPSRDRALWQQWTEFRVNQVSSFVAETSELVHQLNPKLLLSAAVFPMPTQERIQKIQQNWETWAQRGDVDLIVPMTYAEDTNRLQQMAMPWLEETNVDLGSTLVLPGIMLLHLSDQAAFDQIQALRDLPAGGYALFAMAHLNDNLQHILHRTQGDKASPIPYRKPFTAAVDRFIALQREWNFLLSQDQLWMREHDLKEWRSQTEALHTALAELSDQANDRHLQQTQTLLETYRSDFGDWMYSQSLTQDYRVQTWEHRLMTIANLLDYGKRWVE